MDSILTSIKKLLGIGEDYTHFDEDIIMYINNAFFILNQLGVGPDEPFTISDSSSSWTDFTGDSNIESVRTYVFCRVKLVFDPPSNSSLLSAIERQRDELEWRLNVSEDTPS